MNGNRLHRNDCEHIYKTRSLNTAMGELLKVKEKLISDYWLEKFKGTEAGSVGTGQITDVVSLPVEKKLAARINEISKGKPLNTLCVYLAFYKIILSKYFVSHELLVAGFTNGIGNHLPADKNTLLVFKSRVNDDVSVMEYIRTVAADVQQSFSHSNYSEETEKILYVKTGEIPFSFCFNPSPGLKDFNSVNLIITQHLDEVQVDIRFNEKLFSKEFIRQFIAHYVSLLRYTEDLALRISDMEMLSPEQQKVIRDFNNTSVKYPAHKTILDFINDQVKLRPNAVAVACEDHILTYRQLDEQSNQWAHYLLKTGVQKESLVGICIDRSLDLMTGLLGILKAGAAYLPVDPNYPESRINYLLEDSAIEVFLTTSGYAYLTSGNTSISTLIINCDDETVSALPVSLPEIHIGPADLAYVIYTSGSTGKPKGVMNEHRGILNRLLWAQDYFKLDSQDNVLQKTTVSFDVSVWELFWPLMVGAKLVLAKPEGQKDSQYIRDIIEKQKITMLHFVPPMLEAFLDTIAPGDCRSLNKVLCSGEALLPHQVNLFKKRIPQVQLFNLYGPTEAAIDVTCWAAGTQKEEIETVPIGKPVANTSIRIVDPGGKDVPIGVPGELLIGGIQVGRGYMNRPELTAEKFIWGAFENGHAYRTGDVAKWMTNGDIHYLGRNDNQVKIRGFRIDMEEIEFTLAQCPSVSKSILTTRQDPSGHKRLVAYIISTEAFDRELILNYLKSRLPEYMVPTAIMEIKKIPFQPNGKIDRQALPEPHAQLKRNTFPQNEIERDLVKIWTAVLKLEQEQVSVHANFFEMGGDSIIAIQAVNKAKSMGYNLKSQDVFEKQTIAALSKIIQKNSLRTSSQKLLSGPSGKLPIQHYFFENYTLNAPVFNQALLFEIDKSVTTEQLTSVITALVAHNDALRFTYQHQDHNWIQTYGEYKGEVNIADLTTITSPWLLQEAILKLTEEAQQSLDIEKGKLLVMLFIKTPSSETKNRLFLAVHHLAIDGVSWRIIIDQFETALSSIRINESVNLGRKNTSYRDCALFVERYAQSHQASRQLDYWLHTVNSYVPLPVDGEQQLTQFKDIENITITLDENLTRKLLTEVNKAFNTRIDDLLLSSLAKTICDWSNHPDVLIGFEGHGRESNELIDMTGTVGWFTSLYPVLVSVAAKQGSDLIKSVKEQLRGVPDKGMGYGALRYLHHDSEIRRCLSKGKWDVLFNYQGQLDNAISASEWISIASESIASTISPQRDFDTKISVESFITAGHLTITFNYGKKQYRKQTIAQLSVSFMDNLKALIEYCSTRGTEELTPSDYGLAPEVSIEELDSFLHTQTLKGKGQNAINSLARLSPMQHHILQHKIDYPDSEAYIVQQVYELSGSINIPAFEKSWNDLLSSHDILTAAFFHDSFGIPVQGFNNKVAITLPVIDLTTLSEEEKNARIQTIIRDDRKTKFDLQSSPLLRLTLIQHSEQLYTFMWTHHHVLMDGWSVQLLLKELLEIYNTGKKVSGTSSPAGDSYADFIKFVRAKDEVAYEQFWTSELKGTIPVSITSQENEESKENSGQATDDLLQFDEKTTALLKAYSQKNHLTVNTVIQGAWALVLSRLTDRNDVVFGMTVTGRPPMIPDVENKIGLYINTIPIRSSFQNDDKIEQWLERLQHHHTRARDFQYVSLKEIQAWTETGKPLFDSVMVYQNYPNQTEEADISSDNRLSVNTASFWEHSDFPLSIMATMDQRLQVRFGYYSNQIKPSSIDQIKRQFHNNLVRIIQSSSDTMISAFNTNTILESNH